MILRSLHRFFSCGTVKLPKSIVRGQEAVGEALGDANEADDGRRTSRAFTNSTVTNMNRYPVTYTIDAHTDDLQSCTDEEEIKLAFKYRTTMHAVYNDALAESEVIERKYTVC